MAVRRRRQHWPSFILGVTATVLIIVAYTAGALDWAERILLDLRFAYANSLPRRDDIVVIAIDDSSLASVGRWPWPRNEQAALISIAAELGAKAQLIDITWIEPQLVALELPDNADLRLDPRDLRLEDLGVSLADAELAEAIRVAGSVYISFHFLESDADHSYLFTDELEASAAALAGPRRDEALVRAAKSRKLSPEDVIARARLVRALRAAPLASIPQLAQASGLPRSTVESLHTRCVQIAYRMLVQDAAHRCPAEDLPQEWWRVPAALAPLVFNAALEDVEYQLGREFVRAVRDWLNDRALARSSYRVTSQADRLALNVATIADALEPADQQLASAAKRSGFVVVKPDGDGVVRRLPLMAKRRPDGEIYPQLAFAAAMNDLRPGEPSDAPPVVVEHRWYREVHVGSTRVQLDSAKEALIPWVATDMGDLPFQSISATAIMDIYRWRRAIQSAERELRRARDAFFGSDAFASGGAHRELAARRDEAISQLETARFFAPVEERRDLEATITELERHLAEMEKQTQERLFSSEAEATTLVLDDIEFVQRGARTIETLAQDANANVARLRSQIAEQLSTLAPKIRGKYCFVGYTATSLADMTPTPTHPRLPGVFAHAALLNGLLSGRMIEWSTPPMHASLALIAGVLVSFLSVRLTPRTALSVVLLGFVVVGAVAIHLFYFRDYWLAVSPIAGAMAAAYFVIATYRYLFLERERRQLTTALTQYTSPALARQMAENEELCRRAETRSVTSIFTDLRGFTTISENIGAERTQRVLNISLERFSEIMLRHEAMINKFIGDGIFAFWNPVIFPQQDHARRAVITALELIEGLQELIHEQRERGGDEVFSQLVMRIGVATGNAVVGPCGSEKKYDYTCIGDSVNLAARLESGNKFFGTTILLNEATRRDAGDDFVYRPLGGIRVKGKKTAVPIYELIGRAGQTPAALVEYATLFTRGVEQFANREWQKAIEIFHSCARARPEDIAAQNYIELCRSLISSPPTDDWDAALELTEK